MYQTFNIHGSVINIIMYFMSPMEGIKYVFTAAKNVFFVPKNANIAVRFLDDGRPSEPFMNMELSFLGLGLS